MGLEDRMKAVLPAVARPLLESRLPREMKPVWFTSPAEANAMIADAEIAWVDMQPTALVADAIRAAGPALKWVSTLYAGLDAFPLDLLRANRVTVTNGAGLLAHTVADYAVMGVLAGAKRLDEVIRAHDRHEWLADRETSIGLT